MEFMMWKWPGAGKSHLYGNAAWKLGQMVAYDTSQVTKTMNEERNTPGVKIWQRNYYEHIIRNQRSLRRIREYSMNNPKRWDIDQLHPNVPSKW